MSILMANKHSCGQFARYLRSGQMPGLPRSGNQLLPWKLRLYAEGEMANSLAK